jgi:hypothetical protein
MRDLDSLHSRLAREEATLSATHEQVEAALREIEALKEEIRERERQILEAERHIEKLRAHAATIEKRMALLREYIEMVQAGEEPAWEPEPAAAAAPALDEAAADLDPTPEATGAANAEAAETVGAEPPVAVHQEEPVREEPVDEAAIEEETLEPADALADREFVEEMTPPGAVETVEEIEAEPITLENVDPQFLAMEVLPRTETFGEELLLVLACHRKAVAPKDVAKVFRRLEYAPKLSATEENVVSQVDADPHLYESAARGKIALTREGREEAQRLLEQLL